MYQTLALQRDKQFYRLTLNRPEVRNAFNPLMIEELIAAFTEINSLHENIIVVITGRGSSFCTGADLYWMKSMVDSNFHDNLHDANTMFRMFELMMNCPHPIVASVHGHVYGGGLGLISLCDLVLTEKQTKYCFSEVRIGLVPAVISPFVARKVTYSHLNELFLSARIFTAEDAQRLGLVHYLCDSEEQCEKLSSIEKNLLENGAEAMRESKRLLNYIYKNKWDDIRNETTTVIAERRISLEAQLRLQTFLKRKND